MFPMNFSLQHGISMGFHHVTLASSRPCQEAQAMRHYHQASRHILAAVGQRFADVVNAEGETRVVPPTGDHDSKK